MEYQPDVNTVQFLKGRESNKTVKRNATNWRSAGSAAVNLLRVNIIFV